MSPLNAYIDICQHFENVSMYTFSDTFLQRKAYLLHLRAPGQLWMRFWMVGWEKPKKSAPDGTMGSMGLDLKHSSLPDTGKQLEQYQYNCNDWYRLFWVLF